MKATDSVGDLSVTPYCVYTSWKCADGDSNYSEDKRLTQCSVVQMVHTVEHVLHTRLHASTYMHCILMSCDKL